jgi:hypothetical protein
MRRLSLAVPMCLGLLGCAVDHVGPLTVPLTYSPAASPGSPTARITGTLACTTLGPVEVTDARTDKQLGIRTLESKPPQKATVSAGSDPTAWVRQGVDSYLSHNGLVVQGNGPHLLLTLEQLQTTEDAWHRSSYEAVVTLTGELKSPGGRSCWKGSAVGKAGNYGYAGSIENYQQTLNAALDAASQQIVSPQPFRDALCHCGD